jgi:proton-translocating NAD(P)+ transhydrogenase subunit alpha
MDGNRRIGVPKETCPGERRVALVPMSIAALIKAGCEVLIERDAGDEAGYKDSEYSAKGARIAADRAEIFSSCDTIFQVRGYSAYPDAPPADLELLRSGQQLIGFFDPLHYPKAVAALAEKGVTAHALELMPRITRAQSMDVLSSMATVAGYKAVLMAAEQIPKMFPMLMTAAGTISPARVFVIGAGVAGLQAIATAKRLGAVVKAYDVRPAVKTQVESVGAKFVELELTTHAAEDAGGYAKAQDEEFYAKQREMMLHVIAESDVVITTAAIPGMRAPVLVTEEMVAAMPPCSVIVDLAAERGGNCELTRPGEDVYAHHVHIIGPLNVASTVPYHASQMYSRNLTTFFAHLLKMEKDGGADNDEIVTETRLCRGGAVTHARILELLGN